MFKLKNIWLTLKEVMLSVWWNWKRTVQYEHVAAIWQNDGFKLLLLPFNKIKASSWTRSRLEQVRKKGVMLYRDNARPHTSSTARQSATKFQCHSPYRTDLALSDDNTYSVFFFIRTFLIALIHFYWGGAEITCRNFSPGTHRNSIVIGLWCYRKNDKRSSAMILRYKGCLLSFHLKSNKVKRLTYSNDQGAAGQIKNASFLILHVHSKCSQISHSHSCSSISERLLLIQSTYLIFCLNNFVQKYTE